MRMTRAPEASGQWPAHSGRARSASPPTEARARRLGAPGACQGSPRICGVTAADSRRFNVPAPGTSAGTPVRRRAIAPIDPAVLVLPVAGGVGVDDLEGDGVVWVEHDEPVRGEGAGGGGVGRFDPSEGVLVSHGPSGPLWGLLVVAGSRVGCSLVELDPGRLPGGLTAWPARRRWSGAERRR